MSVTRGPATAAGWPGAVRLENDLISLAAVPEIGGRIMEYGFPGENLLWQDARHQGRLYSAEENQGDGSLTAWKNYGGAKLWPAPQGWGGEGQWPGPPDAVLDTGRYQAQERPDGLTLTSPPDPARTGIQITRTLRLQDGATRVAMDAVFQNISDRTVEWAIWEIVQLDCIPRPDAADRRLIFTAPKNPRSRFPQGYAVLHGDPENPQWQPDRTPGVMTVDYDWTVGKIGLDSDGGWAAFHRSDTETAFVLLFPYQADQADRYPDGGCSVECWTTGGGVAAGVDWGRDPAYYLEAEILGPLLPIPPGESRSLAYEWAVCRCPGPVRSASRAGCVSRALHLTPQGHATRISGDYGVFLLGEVVLTVESRNGDRQAILLGEARPHAPVRVDALADVPLAQIARASLRLIDRKDRPWILDSHAA